MRADQDPERDVPSKCVGCQDYDCPKWGEWMEPDKDEAKE